MCLPFSASRALRSRLGPAYASPLLALAVLWLGYRLDSLPTPRTLDFDRDYLTLTSDIGKAISPCKDWSQHQSRNREAPLSSSDIVR
jgi:hypothetical protein